MALSDLACPRCSAPLARVLIDPVNIDECPECGGLSLDADELAQIRR